MNKYGYARVSSKSQEDNSSLEAQKEGKYAGRKTLITKTLINKVKDLKENSNLSVTEISRVIGISRPTIYKRAFRLRIKSISQTGGKK